LQSGEVALKGDGQIGELIYFSYTLFYNIVREGKFLDRSFVRFPILLLPDRFPMVALFLESFWYQFLRGVFLTRPALRSWLMLFPSAHLLPSRGTSGRGLSFSSSSLQRSSGHPWSVFYY